MCENILRKIYLLVELAVFLHVIDNFVAYKSHRLLENQIEMCDLGGVLCRTNVLSGFSIYVKKEYVDLPRMHKTVRYSFRQGKILHLDDAAKS